jgi:phage tail-like protein
MRLTFRTNGVSSPTLHLARIFYPRQSYLNYLPAVYQEDSESRAFLDRFLAIFQADFDAYDNFADTTWKMFDPNTVPAKWFNWLASWLALPIDPSWTEAARRSILKNASKAYRRRGTPDGLTQAIADYSGVQASVVEHYKLRRLTILSDRTDSDKSSASASAQNRLGSGLRLWSRDVYQRLQVGVYSQLGYFRLTSEPEPQLEPLAWGANEFTVMFTADPYTVATTQAAVSKVVEREKPAYTSAQYQPIYARMRVGVQSSIGIDTRVGEATYIVLSKVGTLGYDSMLSASTTAKALHTAGQTTPAQTGINTRLS